MYSNFTVVGIGNERYPKETGAYTCVIISRDGKQVLRTLYFIRDDEYSGSWAKAEISEYGYYSFNRIDADYIHSYQRIHGVDVNVVPEQLTVNVINIITD